MPKKNKKPKIKRKVSPLEAQPPVTMDDVKRVEEQVLDTPTYTQAGTPWPQHRDGTPGERMAARSAAHQGDLPGAEHPGGSEIDTPTVLPPSASEGWRSADPTRQTSSALSDRMNRQLLSPDEAMKRAEQMTHEAHVEEHLGGTPMPRRSGSNQELRLDARAGLPRHDPLKRDFMASKSLVKGPDCCLCGEPCEAWEYGGGFGNNPQPLADPPARCCNRCNSTKVVPARFGHMPELDPLAASHYLGGATSGKSDMILTDAFGTEIPSEVYKDVAERGSSARVQTADIQVRPGGFAPPIRTAADVAELRNWLVKQWQPNGIFERAALSHPTYGASSSRRTFIESERVQLQRAALYWVAKPMVDLLTSVLPSMMDDVKPTDLTWPDENGFVVFATPIAGHDAMSAKGDVFKPARNIEDLNEVRVDAIAWCMTSIADSTAPGGRRQCVSVSSYRMVSTPTNHSVTIDAKTSIDDFDKGKRDSTSNFGEDITMDGAVWAPLGRSDWPITSGLGEQDHWIPDVSWPSFKEDRQLIATLFTLLEDRTQLADKVVQGVPRHITRRGERENLRITAPKTIVVVTLRQPRHAHVANPDSVQPVQRTHRWLVRAHPCWQPYGPGRAQRKLIIRRAHIKGPDDMPLIIKTRVNAWIR